MYLDVGNGHKIYYEEYGDPKGIKILFLHGGPGLGCSENDKLIFDQAKFHVIFIDQRGCGRSLPKGFLDHNTTQDLVSDINQILDHLDIDSVIVFGGSWGATLAILFAAENPDRVDKLILRGFFSATKECTDIYLRGKIKSTHPKTWERVSSFVPLSTQNKVAEFYYEAIDNESENFQKLAYQWSRYGLSLSRKHISDAEIDQILGIGEIDLDRIRIELNYALNGFFIPEGLVFDQASKIVDIPTTIIHGRYDYLCPLDDAKKLASLFINVNLKIVDGGHSPSEKMIRKVILEELDLL